MLKFNWDLTWYKWCLWWCWTCFTYFWPWSKFTQFLPKMAIQKSPADSGCFQFGESSSNLAQVRWLLCEIGPILYPQRLVVSIIHHESWPSEHPILLEYDTFDSMTFREVRHFMLIESCIHTVYIYIWVIFFVGDIYIYIWGGYSGMLPKLRLTIQQWPVDRS